MALPLIPIISGLASLAPTVAGWLGGDKAEDAAQSIADMARTVTGQNDAQQAVNMIKADPAMQLEFLKLLESNKYALDKMYLQDRQHAREHNKQSIMPAVIVVALTLIVAAMGYAMFKVAIPDDNQTLANILFGAVLAKWADSVAYWVGSSKGSADKNKWK